MTTGMWIKLGAFIGLLLAIYLGYTWVTGVVAKNNELTLAVDRLQTSLETERLKNENYENAILEWKESQDNIEKMIGALQKNGIESRGELRRISDVLSKHNLGELAVKKPGLIERRINAGTSRALRMLECSSGNGGRCESGQAEESNSNTGPRADTD